jgi:biopolymer transport protein ExbD
MQVPRHRRKSEFGFNMTPMIDVVFLLIIFFLVSSHLAKQESQLQLPLPVAESGIEAQVDNAPRVVVNVRSDGSILLAGTPVTPDELQRRLGFERERRAAQQPTADNADGGSLQVRVRGDRRVPYRFIEPVMLAAFREQIYNVTFAVYRSEDVPR